MDVDTLLTTARATFEQAVREDAQALLDRLGTGLRLEAVEARDLSPPGAVVDAFNDVSSARGDQETVVLAAESYASRRLPDERGQAAQLLEEAQAHANRVRVQADADADRFETFLTEHRRSPQATRLDLVSRLWQDAQDLEVIVATPNTRVVLPR
jgi:membrane protease subunit HflK